MGENPSVRGAGSRETCRRRRMFSKEDAASALSRTSPAPGDVPRTQAEEEGRFSPARQRRGAAIPDANKCNGTRANLTSRVYFSWMFS